MTALSSVIPAPYQVRGKLRQGIHKNKGFTLVELLVVIAIIAVISVIGIVVFTGIQKGARDSKRRADINSVAKAYEVKYNQTGTYGALDPSLEINQELFASKQFPKDPQGADYGITQNPSSSGFRICATLEDNTSFCKTSIQAEAPPLTGGTSDNTKVITAGSGDGSTSTCQKDGLLGYWKMDEGSWNGTQGEVKSSQGTNHGTALAGATTVAGKINKAGDFNAGGKTVQLSTSIPLAGVSYSIAAWSKFPLLNQDTWKTLTRGISNDHQILVGGNSLGVYDNASGTAFHASGYDISALSGWHHITAVGSGSSTKFYIDGVLKGESNFKSNAEITFIGNCYAGCGQWWGQLDDVRIYNKPLSASEVSALSSCVP